MNSFDFEVSLPAFYETPEGVIVKATYENQVAAIYATQQLEQIFQDNKRIQADV